MQIYTQLRGWGLTGARVWLDGIFLAHSMPFPSLFDVREMPAAFRWIFFRSSQQSELAAGWGLGWLVAAGAGWLGVSGWRLGWGVGGVEAESGDAAGDRKRKGVVRRRRKTRADDGVLV